MSGTIDAFLKLFHYIFIVVCVHCCTDIKALSASFCATVIHSDAKLSPRNSPRAESNPMNFTVVSPQNCLPVSLFHFPNLHTHRHTHAHTHTHVHDLLCCLITHHWLLHLGWACAPTPPLWVKLRGNSQGAGKVGCWCGSVGRRRRCRGLCWGASRSEPCRRPSPSALESAHTVAVPTEERGKERRLTFLCALLRHTAKMLIYVSWNIVSEMSV